MPKTPKIADMYTPKTQNIQKGEIKDMLMLFTLVIYSFIENILIFLSILFIHISHILWGKRHAEALESLHSHM